MVFMLLMRRFITYWKSIYSRVTVGIVLLILAGAFIAFAMRHPESSFPWSQRVTFMLYGAYIWFVFKFLVGIPVLRKVNPGKNNKTFAQAMIHFFVAVVFLLMEITGDEVTGYSIIRGFIVVGSCDMAIENICKRKLSLKKRNRQ